MTSASAAFAEPFRRYHLHPGRSAATEVPWEVAPRAPVQGLTLVAAARLCDAREGRSMTEEVEWFVGIDWASQSHQVCLVNARGECLGERAVAHGGPGIEELCNWLIARTGA